MDCVNVSVKERSDGYYIANYDASPSEKDVSGCRSRCISKNGCDVWSFNSQTQKCFLGKLKSTEKLVVQKEKNTKSGIIECVSQKNYTWLMIWILLGIFICVMVWLFYNHYIPTHKKVIPEMYFRGDNQ